jgi:sigma-E factor negative regulatory protein RseA
MNDSDKLREQVSALLDGQLHGAEFAHAVERLCADDELRGAWHTYHVVGDVLRSGEHVACRDSRAFLGRFRERLAVEDVGTGVTPAPMVVTANRSRIEAANEPVFRWKLVAGLASVAAAAAIGWNWSSSVLQGPAGAQVAQQQNSGAVPVLASSTLQPADVPPTTATRVLVGEGQTPQVMLRDSRLDALLEAHQQAGGASHMPSGFLRNATFEGQSR